MSGTEPDPDEPGPSPTAAPDDVDAALRSELERVRQERDTALAASQARASFLAQMSHEIREPMNNVLGMARLLRDTPLDPEQRGYVDAVVDAAEALLTLINDILDLTRIDAGRLELDETDVALRPFLDRLRALLEPQARRKGLAFTVEADASVPPLLHTDPSRLRQVLINLAANALKFTEQGRVAIRFSLCPAPAGKVGVRVEVEDTGPGIPRPARDRLFEAYVQADHQVARLFGGSGLGLMIAHRLSRALGGEIAVRSDTLAGTTFMVDLALSPPAGEAAGTGVAAVPPSLAGCSLLVVDPQERTRSAIVELASGWGIAARGARSATQGLALLDEAADRGAPYHAVLIDRVLPDLPGNQLGQRILAEARYGRPHLVLLVASGIRGDAARARADGFSAYLPKPVTAQMLLECLTVLRAGAAGAEHAGEGGGAAAAGPLITVHTMADRRPHLDVLVADDNAVNCRLLQIVLERAGHRVTVVRNGLEAVRALEGSPFDLVLMDIQMPTMDGLEATRRIRQLPDPVRATTPVVAVTANAMRGDVTACYAAGMDGYVTKPVTMASLNDAIGRSLSPRRPPPAPAKADRPLAPDAALPPAPMST